MAICARSAASRRRALAKLGAVAASATEHDDVSDGARRRQNRQTRRRRGIARRRGAARCSGAKACVAALASDAHLIPEKPAAWEELPRRNRRWRVLKNWTLTPGVLCVGELADVESGTCARHCRRRRAAPGDRSRADAACELLTRAPIKSAALLWSGDTLVTNSAYGGRKTCRVRIGSRAVGRGRRPGLEALRGRGVKAPILRAATGLENQSCTVSRSTFTVCNSKVLASRQNV